MLLEHVLAPWEQQAFGGGADRYAEQLAAVRAVIGAAPEQPPAAATSK